MPEPNTRCGMTMEQAVDPIDFFNCWMEDAKHSELNDPNAMSLATATPDGLPSVRIVLLKTVDAKGFSFYTNGESRKGRELRANTHAALALHWKSRQRQVRVEGTITELPPEDVDAYFKRRHRMSQIGAWASQQSRPLDSRAALLQSTEEIEKRFPGEVPRPPYWTGFVVKPTSIEFWQEGDYRLHDRIVFTPTPNNSWTKQRLYP
ncbi:pyridoxamine 5'-phosphate oxidase [Granulicella tundricola]|uniref:Pyridoxamine 5'-phosphate oxidase n=1 Tax=Granulicella tundricola (strain ATCC BAA-1859 / DSM 23138 / MP5ACTX9) TaxID=1198114 RepID=E8WVK4_GRATM|nr:pyridoxamine 5'-phosphate oxidase [Granulicella tundricola]ADW69533.1 pyridoxamine 5'-phosphate oxidase [Granulicella tundricola MP5ACTX9]